MKLSWNRPSERYRTQTSDHRECYNATAEFSFMLTANTCYYVLMVLVLLLYICVVLNVLYVFYCMFLALITAQLHAPLGINKVIDRLIEQTLNSTCKHSN